MAMMVETEAAGRTRVLVSGGYESTLNNLLKCTKEKIINDYLNIQRQTNS